ncbi:hypothetical protein BBP00_00010101 [Phytophthora kernoviae]|uniref:Cas12f1-like TNB domain-containing protein n=1 Tax=Phytophthora kernoviae TaxID=325452 RepID=A0A3F2RAN4_9STRA|nr:hypothetical protein BBP00_00010101 [Phytophthora kernoviae]
MVRKHFEEVASDATPETASDEMRAAVLKRKIRSPTARAMMAQAHYRFKMLLKYKMVRSGGRVINCEEEYTSKTCSRCGAINHKLGGKHVFQCPSCNVSYQRPVDNFMGKERFTVNPFAELGLSPNNRLKLQDLANSLILDNLTKFSAFRTTVDSQQWKLIKDHRNLKMYTERSSSTSSDNIVSGNGLPIILGIGALEGKLDDLMFGAISTTLEEMRIKASYVDGFSKAAVLDTIVKPSPEEPFLSLIVKWTEVDIPFASTSIVKNRDYVFIEGTGYLPNDTRPTRSHPW